MRSVKLWVSVTLFLGVLVLYFHGSGPCFSGPVCRRPTKSRKPVALKDLLVTRANLTSSGSYDVLLSAYMNSGSRFTGRLLGFRADSFYFYEPLWRFSTWDYYRPPNVCCSSTSGGCRNVTTEEVNRYLPFTGALKEETVIEGFLESAEPRDLLLYVLSSVFSCQLTKIRNVVQERVHDHISYSGPSWDSYRQCSQKLKGKTKCLRGLQAVCRNKTTRVAKVIRLTVGAMEPLLEAIPRLKIVHLVRDPRAIIHSRLFSRGYPVYGYRQNNSLERNLCAKMLRDIQDFVQLKKKFPNRLVILYYEDLLSNLHVRLKHLYKYLNVTYKKSEIDQLASIQVNLSPPEKPFRAISADRKADNAFWWRKHMTWTDMERVDNACNKVYQVLGYKMFETEAQLRNMNYSNLNIPKRFLF